MHQRQSNDDIVLTKIEGYRFVSDIQLIEINC